MGLGGLCFTVYHTSYFTELENVVKGVVLSALVTQTRGATWYKGYMCSFI